MTSELEEIFSELLDKSEEFKDCPLCHEGILKYTPSLHIEAIIFQCSKCYANLRWSQLTPEEKIRVFYGEMKRVLKKLTPKQRAILFRRFGSYV